MILVLGALPIVKYLKGIAEQVLAFISLRWFFKVLIYWRQIRCILVNWIEVVSAVQSFFVKEISVLERLHL